MLTVWGRANSSNVMKVLWLLDDLGVPYRREDAGGAFGRTRDPEYLALNPNSLVPVLVEPDGFALWESNAILRYLASTRPGGEACYPADRRRRAAVDQWLDWQLSALTRPTTTMFLNHVRLPVPDRDPVAASRARDEAERLWRILDARLAGREWVCDSFSLAEIALSIFAHRWFSLPVARPELPNLADWYARLGRCEGFRRHVAVPLS